MRDNQCDRIKLVAIRYEEQIGNISREEAHQLLDEIYDEYE